MNKLSTNLDQFELDTRFQNSYNNQENISTNEDRQNRINESTTNHIEKTEEKKYQFPKTFLLDRLLISQRKQFLI